MLYFFSYARADETRFLKKFYADLREAVRSKAGFPDAESIAFRDVQTIEPGKPWPAEIEKALQNCKVFVYLHTPTYLERHGCGKEFQVIKHRLASSTGGNGEFGRASCIQPIYWDGPKTARNVPSEILCIQLTHDAYGKRYNEEGMLNLTRSSYDSSSYWQAVDQIARRIQEAANNAPLPELAQRPVWNQISPLFPTTSVEKALQPVGPTLNHSLRPPRHAYFVWVVGKRDELVQLRSVDAYDEAGIPEEWRPFLPDCDDPARLIAQDAAREVKLTYIGKSFPASREDLQRLIEEAGDDYTPVVVVVDLWSLHVDKYRAIVKMFDRGTLHHCYVIFPWNMQDTETGVAREDLRHVLLEVFPVQFTKPDTMLVFEGVNSLVSFKEEVTKRLTKYMADVNRSLHVARKLPESSVFSLPPQLPPA